MPSAHAKLPPSGAYRWRTCPGSPALCASVVDSSSIYSEEGTAGHEVFAECADTNKNPLHFVGKKMSNGIEITEELAEHVVTAIEWVEFFRETHPEASIFKEQKFEIGEGLGLTPGILWGTADFAALTKTELVIADLKLGFVLVDVEGNEQLILYGLGAMDKTGWIYDRIRLVILQPKKDLAPKEIVYTREQMEAFAAEMKSAAEAALEPDAPRIPSKAACQFCKAAGACPELRSEMLALVNRDFSTLHTISGEQIGELLTKAKMIDGAIKSLRAHALRCLEIDPNYVPGWKRVKGEKKRRYKNEDTALAEIQEVTHGMISDDELAPRKLATPLQVETKIAAMLREHAITGPKNKRFTKKAAMESAVEMISHLVEKPEGEATLVPAEDKRDALAPVFTAEEVAQLETEQRAALEPEVLPPLAEIKSSSGVIELADLPGLPHKRLIPAEEMFD